MTFRTLWLVSHIKLVNLDTKFVTAGRNHVNGANRARASRSLRVPKDNEVEHRREFIGKVALVVRTPTTDLLAFRFGHRNCQSWTSASCRGLIKLKEFKKLQELKGCLGEVPVRV
jgi:hypothetical protein